MIAEADAARAIERRYVKSCAINMASEKIHLAKRGIFGHVQLLRQRSRDTSRAVWLAALSAGSMTLLRRAALHLRLRMREWLPSRCCIVRRLDAIGSA